MTAVIYLASSIDQGTEYTKEKAREALLKASCAVFDPAGGWGVPASGDPSPALQEANLALLRECDGLFAILNPTTLTIGVIIEIQEAKLHGIPTVVYAPGIRTSWSLAYLGLDPHQTLPTAIAALKKGTST